MARAAIEAETARLQEAARAAHDAEDARRSLELEVAKERGAAEEARRETTHCTEKLQAFTTKLTKVVLAKDDLEAQVHDRRRQLQTVNHEKEQLEADNRHLRSQLAQLAHLEADNRRLRAERAELQKALQEEAAPRGGTVLSRVSQMEAADPHEQMRDKMLAKQKKVEAFGAAAPLHGSTPPHGPGVSSPATTSTISVDTHDVGAAAPAPPVPPLPSRSTGNAAEDPTVVGREEASSASRSPQLPCAHFKLDRDEEESEDETSLGSNSEEESKSQD